MWEEFRGFVLYRALGFFYPLLSLEQGGYDFIRQESGEIIRFSEEFPVWKPLEVQCFRWWNYLDDILTQQHMEKEYAA